MKLYEFVKIFGVRMRGSGDYLSSLVDDVLEKKRN